MLPLCCASTRLLWLAPQALFATTCLTAARGAAPAAAGLRRLPGPPSQSPHAYPACLRVPAPNRCWWASPRCLTPSKFFAASRSGTRGTTACVSQTAPWLWPLSWQTGERAVPASEQRVMRARFPALQRHTALLWPARHPALHCPGSEALPPRSLLAWQVHRRTRLLRLPLPQPSLCSRPACQMPETTH